MGRMFVAKFGETRAQDTNRDPLGVYRTIP